MSALQTRCAPSPTGRLHLGHAAHMVWLWGLAKQMGARVLLRVEDHDRTRCRAEYERGILEDLAWLGFVPDEPAVSAFDGPTPFRQSQRGAVYQNAWERLRKTANVYACRCSRREIQLHWERLGKTARDFPGGEWPYPGTCRRAGHAPTEGNALRVELPEVSVHFEDGLLGPQGQTPVRQCGDVLLRDRDGCWTYQFCAAVDDLEMGVDLVIRGVDLLESTGRQILLARMLGRAQDARYFHHPLIQDPSGRKLAKRDGDESLAGLRALGHTPSGVRAQAARLSGWQER